MRMKIISALSERPWNVNELARNLGVDYKTIQYQVGVLLKNKLIETPERESYGAIYFLTPLMLAHLDYIKEIWDKYGKKKINKDEGKGGGE